MKFRNFETKIKGLLIFNLNDIRKIDPEFHRQQLSYWKDQGYIKTLAGGYYILSTQTVDESLLLFAANKMYKPSYLSLETALAYHSIIPESVLGMTSVSSRKTIKFESDWGGFRYRKIKSSLLFGYQLIETNHHVKYKIATLEKTVLDYLYLHFEIESIIDFVELRWNKYQLQSLKESKIIRQYLNVFNHRALEKRVSILMEYLDA